MQQIQVLNDQGLLEEDDGDKADLIEDEMERLIHKTEIFLKHHKRIQKIEINRIKLWEIIIMKQIHIREKLFLIKYSAPILHICILFCFKR